MFGSSKLVRAVSAIRRRFSGRDDSEHEQAFVRLVIGILVFLYFFQLSLHHESNENWNVNFLWVMLVFIALSIILITHIAAYPRISPIRRLLAASLDSLTITYFFFNAAESAIPLYFLYLWIIFGYGFRFGKRYMFFTLALSLIGFGGVILVVPYWSQNLFLGIGLWAGMLLVSLYVSTLVGRLTAALKHAEAANQAKRRFISSVSHELRTPLNALIGMADLLRSTKLGTEQAEMVRSMDNASHIMLSLIEDVLDFSKIEAGKLVIENTEFDLRQLVNSTIDIFRYQVAERGLRLLTYIDPGAPNALRGDPHHLRQVLVNLLSNSIKFTEEGRVVLRIDCQADTTGAAKLRFEVEDTGIGIAAEAQVKVFESFTQADESTSRRYGGTGLGTTISKQLVELMGGKLGLRSELGVGSVFWFELEFQKQSVISNQQISDRSADAVSPQKASLPENDQNKKPQHAQYNILVAEDNPTNSKVIQKILERAGHLCTLVQNGEEALDRLDQQDFDVIVFDMNMPVMNGLEATKAYRFMRAADMRAPIIMFSANVTKEAKEECLSAGVDEFLPKPIQIASFLETLDRLVEKFDTVRRGRMPHQAFYSAPIMAQPAGASNILNYSTLAELENIGQNKMFVDGLLAGFIADNQKLVGRLEETLLLRQFEEFKEILHAIKGSAASIGAMSLRTTCQKFEMMSQNELKNKTQEILYTMGTSFNQLCEALDHYRNQRDQSASHKH
jgi:two-component system sensor histidine kinase RpfC